MNIRSFYICVCALLLSLASLASPARRGSINLTQPDGTTFTAYLTGDEFARIKTTADGHAIIQDEDGWWFYAIYESDGGKKSSGHKVGSDVPGHIKSLSLHIPYSIIGDNAIKARQINITNQDPSLIRTKSEG